MDKDLNTIDEEVDISNLDANFLNLEITQYEKSKELTVLNLVSQLENLGLEKEKDEFIKNYGNLKEQIEITDLILSDSVESIKIFKKYEKMNINELFDLLEKNNEFIINPKNLTSWRFKHLLIISKVLEQKLDKNTFDVIESK